LQLPAHSQSLPAAGRNQKNIHLIYNCTCVRTHAPQIPTTSNSCTRNSSPRSIYILRNTSLDCHHALTKSPLTTHSVETVCSPQSPSSKLSSHLHHRNKPFPMPAESRAQSNTKIPISPAFRGTNHRAPLPPTPHRPPPPPPQASPHQNLIKNLVNTNPSE
jgi:hypothetical protein